MLGYKEDDVIKMMASINIARYHYITVPQDTNIEEIRDGLSMAYDFLEGALAEGRIN
jgi:hypothetical protein